MITEQFISDGCTGIPDLWFQGCCVAHDYAYEIGTDPLTADLEFMKCVVEESQWLGPLGYAIGGLLFLGLLVFRPLYKFYKKQKESGNIENVTNDKMNG
jgi:hypothetical protein